MRRTLMRRVAVIGVGVTKFGLHDRTSAELFSAAESTEYFAYASDAVWEQPLGLTFPGVFALIARAHMEKHGTTEAQMAAVAVKNHRHGVLNPKAQFQKPITVDQVLKSPYVADPLKLLDCCPFSDGGAAVVVASEEVARRHRRPAWVLAP